MDIINKNKKILLKEKESLFALYYNKKVNKILLVKILAKVGEKFYGINKINSNCINFGMIKKELLFLGKKKSIINKINNLSSRMTINNNINCEDSLSIQKDMRKEKYKIK